MLPGGVGPFGVIREGDHCDWVLDEEGKAAIAVLHELPESLDNAVTCTEISLAEDSEVSADDLLSHTRELLEIRQVTQSLNDIA